MKKGNSQPEIKFLKRIVNPISKKVITDSTILLDKNFEKSFHSYLIETIYLYSNEDIEKETRFVTENDVNELIKYYNSKITIGPKLNLEINNIQNDLDESDLLALHLNLISDPSESILFLKKNRRKIINKDNNQIIHDDLSSSSDFSYNMEPKHFDLNKQQTCEMIVKVIDNNELTQMENPQLKKEVIISRNNIKQGKKECNCVCTIF
jgi:hypothetical protein